MGDPERLLVGAGRDMEQIRIGLDGLGNLHPFFQSVTSLGEFRPAHPEFNGEKGSYRSPHRSASRLENALGVFLPNGKAAGTSGGLCQRSTVNCQRPMDAKCRAFRGLPGALRHRNGSVGAAFLPCGGLFSASLRRPLHASLRIPYAFRYFSTRSLSFSVTSGSRVRSMLFRRSAFFTAMA